MGNLKPIEDALLLLEAVFRHMKKGAEFIFETADVIQILDTSILKENKIPLGEILVTKGIVDQISLDQTLATQKTQPDKKIGELLVQESKVAPAQIAQALLEQKTDNRKGTLPKNPGRRSIST